VPPWRQTWRRIDKFRAHNSRITGYGISKFRPARLPVNMGRTSAVKPTLETFFRNLNHRSHSAGPYWVTVGIAVIKPQGLEGQAFKKRAPLWSLTPGPIWTTVRPDYVLTARVAWLRPMNNGTIRRHGLSTRMLISGSVNRISGIPVLLVARQFWSTAVTSMVPRRGAQVIRTSTTTLWNCDHLYVDTPTILRQRVKLVCLNSLFSCRHHLEQMRGAAGNKTFSTLDSLTITRRETVDPAPPTQYSGLPARHSAGM
jgi:hypothetical protein